MSAPTTSTGREYDRLVGLGWQRTRWLAGHMTEAPERTDLAVVFGGAACLWRDFEVLVDRWGGPWPGLILAVNEVGCILPRLEHWASLHPEKFRTDRAHPEGLGWLEQRRTVDGLPTDAVTTWSRTEGATDRFLRVATGGSSGLLAVLVGLEVTDGGRVAGCGLPLDAQGHFAESRVHRTSRTWGSADHRLREWQDRRTLQVLMGRVRCVSGATADLLGRPTHPWLKGESQ